MKHLSFAILNSMNERFRSSASTVREIYRRVHSSVSFNQKTDVSIDEVIKEFLMCCTQTPHAVRQYLSAELSQELQSALSDRLRGDSPSSLLGDKTQEAIGGYDILLQYKLPFSPLGVDAYLVYTKLRFASQDRYMAIWIKRNIHSQVSWKIEDFLVHDAFSTVSLGVEDQTGDGQTYTVRGRLLNDSTSAALFFIRLLSGSCSTMPKDQVIDPSKRCNEEFLNTLQQKVKELLKTLHLYAFKGSPRDVDPKLQGVVLDYQSAFSSVSGHEENDFDKITSYRLLSLYRVPSTSEHTMRILVHIYVPSVNQYFSIWFSRSSLKSLKWRIDDFYMHKFGKIKPFAHADKSYCKDHFRTLKTRLFYTADLMGDQFLRSTGSLSSLS